MNKTIKTTQQLKKLLNELHKRDDLKFSSFDVRKPATKTALAEKQDRIPPSLLDYYSVMNGCDIYASFVNDSSLKLGLRIPEIEKITSFTEPEDYYNFDKDEKIITIEWIEITMSTFFFILDKGEGDISKSYIVSAYAARENSNTFVAQTMSEFLEKAMDAALTLGWACDTAETNADINSIKKLLSAKPKNKKVFQKGDRVEKRQEDAGRGTVIKAIETVHSHEYYGKDYVLVDFDYRGKCWVRASTIKMRPKKKDHYDKILNDPEAFIKDVQLMKPEDSAAAFFKIGTMNGHFCGINEMEHISYPVLSLRYTGIFNRVSLTEAIDCITTLMQTWALSGQENNNIPFEKDGTEYNKKDFYIKDSDELHYSKIIETILGCLTYLVLKNKIEGATEPILTDSQKDALFSVFALLEKFLSEAGINTFSFHFGKLINAYDSFLSLNITSIDSHNFSIDREDWLDKLKLDKPYGFWY